MYRTACHGINRAKSIRSSRGARFAATSRRPQQAYPASAIEFGESGSIDQVHNAKAEEIRAITRSSTTPTPDSLSGQGATESGAQRREGRETSYGIARRHGLSAVASRRRWAPAGRARAHSSCRTLTGSRVDARRAVLPANQPKVPRRKNSHTISSTTVRRCASPFRGTRANRLKETQPFLFAGKGADGQFVATAFPLACGRHGRGARRQRYG